MKKIGFVGWRGMVGSVLMQRIKESGDWGLYKDKVFFSTSDTVKSGPDGCPLKNPNNLEELSTCDIIVTCQGGDWTGEIHPKLKQRGWPGIFIDASSALRTNPDSVIVLDPINRRLINSRLAEGCKIFVGGNCTTSLMMMALQGLLDKGVVKWIYSSTYQAASGAGAKNMEELLVQMNRVSRTTIKAQLENPYYTALDLDRAVTGELHLADFPTKEFGAPLALSLIPWIDKGLPDGRTKEEWKMGVEAKKILGLPDDCEDFSADSLCTRISSLRCHSQSILVALNQDLTVEYVEKLIANGNHWVKFVPNDKESTLRELSPVAVSGKLDIAVGRLHRCDELPIPNLFKMFTVGDQLLWGAAEPIRRILKIVSGYAVGLSTQDL